MKVLGHRGWPAPLHPENTLAAFSAALDVGADGVEVDVRLSADGLPLCCHDDDLARVGAHLPSVAAATSHEVRRVLLTGGHRVPPLVEVLALAQGRGAVVLDVKPDPRPERVLRACLSAVRRSGLPVADLVLSSFDQRMLDVLALRAPRVARAGILEVGEAVQPALARARRRGDRAVHLPLSAVLSEPGAVRCAVAGGMQVRAWTVNRLVDARLCEVLGVDAVITDEPALLAAGRLATAS